MHPKRLKCRNVSEIKIVAFTSTLVPILNYLKKGPKSLHSVTQVKQIIGSRGLSIIGGGVGGESADLNINITKSAS